MALLLNGCATPFSGDLYTHEVTGTWEYRARKSGMPDRLVLQPDRRFQLSIFSADEPVRMFGYWSLAERRILLQPTRVYTHDIRHRIAPHTRRRILSARVPTVNPYIRFNWSESDQTGKFRKVSDSAEGYDSTMQN